MLLECKNLTIGYNNHAVSENINFSIQRGDYLCICGENGAGKSTLLKTILGLLPPISGEIYLTTDFNREDIGYMPQQSMIQRNFPATVMEIVLTGRLQKMKNRVFYDYDDRDTAERLISKLGLSEYKKANYKSLSGGQQQRVLLARALFADTRMLFLDEPTAGLDPKATKDLYNTIFKLCLDGTAIVMVSHDVDAIRENANKVLFLSIGGYWFGTADEFLLSDRINKLSGGRRAN